MLAFAEQDVTDNIILKQADLNRSIYVRFTFDKKFTTCKCERLYHSTV